MKLIHCADLHLDSKLNANLDREQAKERRAELLHTFERMIAYGCEHQVRGILLAGDVFDTKTISVHARTTVMSMIEDHPEIDFYYLRGNHDGEHFLDQFEKIPENLKTFCSEWTYYSLGNCVIAGLEIEKENQGSMYHTLNLDASKFNIVMLHGQDGEHFQIHGLRNKGIDYLALGHIHSYQKEKLDARGIFCYPGCLEGRGFDECGEHGFTLMEISEETGAFTHAFIPFASRNLYTIPVSVQECTSSYEIGEKIKEALRSTLCERKDLIKILLTGALDVNCEKNLIYLHSKFAQDYYFFKISDETTWKVDPEEYLLDESLKGEFVRTVLGEQELSLEEKNEIIRYGLQAIAGEEIGADAITTMSH